MVGVLFSPDETFRDIARRPDIVVPLLVFVAITILSSILIVPHMDIANAMRDQLANSGRNMSADDIERSVRMMSAFSKVMGYASPLFGIAVWAIFAALLLFGFRAFGAEGTYKQSFSVVLYAWVPLIIQQIITTIIALFRGSVDPREMAAVVASTPAFFISFKDHPVAFAFLSSIDLFSIWMLFLLTIGFAYVARVSKARSAVTVVSIWAFFVLVKVGFAAMGAAKVKASS